MPLRATQWEGRAERGTGEGACAELPRVGSATANPPARAGLSPEPGGPSRLNRVDAITLQVLGAPAASAATANPPGRAGLSRAGLGDNVSDRQGARLGPLTRAL